MTPQEKRKLWDEFIQKWPVERLHSMTLEEYTKLKGQDSFCYWLESKTQDLGSIWGGSAFKFGIFEYNPEHEKELPKHMVKDDKYAWYAKYGDNREDVFKTIRGIITTIAEASRKGDYSDIDKQDLGQVTKWKIAFLYQNMEEPHLVCIYKTEQLKKIANMDTKNSSELFKSIYESKPDGEDIFAYSDKIWESVHAAPMSWLIASGEQGKFWEDFRTSEKIKMGWNEMGDLSYYEDEEQLSQDLPEHYPEFRDDTGNGAEKNSRAKMMWDFCHSMNVGDTVYVRKGLSQIVGVGEVKSDYTFDETGDWYHTREVQWLKTGEWDAQEFLKGKMMTLIRLEEKDRNMLATLVGLEPGGGVGAEEEKGQDVKKESTQFAALRKDHPCRNIILYGPPGTGKTHTLLKDYVERYFSSPDEHVKALNCWQVLAVALADIKTPVVGAELEQHPLVREYCRCSSGATPENSIRARLQEHTKDDCPNVTFKRSRKNPPLIFWKDGDSKWQVDWELAVKEKPELQTALSAYQNDAYKRYAFVTFHQSYSYENFVEGISAETDSSGQLSYKVSSGIFVDLCERARNNPSEPHALFIDEINRGNVSGIFGELITLIEDNKRQGQAEEIAVTLPYSKRVFTVPENLYIIGSMNTADRSIDALDTALRRRFSFVEVPPQPQLLSQPEFRPQHVKLDLKALLESINQRVEYLLDRDHCIGHSYFMKVRDDSYDLELSNLRRVFKDHIIPLLEDYFYGNLDKVAMVLGSTFVSSGKKLDVSCLLESGDDLDLPEKHIRAIADLSALKEEDFAALISK